MRAKKSLGQNFLVDPRHQRRIVDALAVGPADEVLEIGPGRGALTRHLVGRARRIVLVELDDALVADLRGRWEDRDDVEIVHGDALELDLRDLLEDPSSAKILGNIPYGITSPLLFKLLERPRAAVIQVMVQREVGDRLSAEPGTREYGALAVGVGALADVVRLFQVPRSVFRPVPRVDSTVVRIVPHVPPRLTATEEADLRVLTRASFQWRRKQLGKILREHPDVALPRDVVERVAKDTQIALSDRPEMLSPGRLLELSRAVAGARG
ncbi:MAG: 16S rRNA (adenine(1518)-N(6)/adenine(1519)-N(6))-dimethyltransferase RsmA [Gemmatimonadota bacterium]|nr:16S rRNA (adenine(1518)-N(6)/adenine(1519)-N(6))-dimethyltransferase RsmA [Gemmatimonadota bacterium]